ncbi:hemerythrin HHE cation binding domain-containing protein [Thermasporomyces composti]|jgi:predicted nucleic acid-binding protein|uniref:Hemerythrin HHE cation binding domain-containing protein n=1 Tax=Thermasporomyces composti TaxID=696763 RepID=A0A3D9V0N3_THECX|nr:hemerythrin HHE cation binding domain-containing protein [Thermasporomyces composti]
MRGVVAHVGHRLRFKRDVQGRIPSTTHRLSGEVEVPDVVDLIMSDHREVERLLTLVKDHPDQRPLQLPVLSALLIAHSRAEEAEVYPVARIEADEADEVALSQEEHLEAERLLEQLHGLDPMSKRFDSVLDKLIAAVKEHIEHEESVVLPELRQQVDKARREELGEIFATARETHLGELPGQATRAELVAQARNVGVPGASSMTRSQLQQTLRV